MEKLNTDEIKSEEEYDLCVARLEKIFFATEGTKEFDELSILCNKIEKYEEKHYPIGTPSEEEMAQFMKEQKIEKWD